MQLFGWACFLCSENQDFTYHAYIIVLHNLRMNRQLAQPQKFLNQRYKTDKKFFKLFHDEGLYHIEASPLIFSVINGLVYM